MSLRFAVKQDRAGCWSIQLPRELSLGQAIKTARALAREHHERTGATTSVELTSAEAATLLAQYAKSAEPAETIAACA